MDVRSLAIMFGFKVDKASVTSANTTIENVKKTLEKTGDSAKEMGQKADEGLAKVAKSSDAASKNVDKVAKSVDKSSKSIKDLMGRLNNMLAFAGVSFTVGSIIKTIDEWKVAEGQINNVTKSQEESKAVQNEVYNIASRTRQQYQSTAELYTSVARNAQELKKSTKDILLFTEDVSNAMLLGGGAAESQKAALVQLGQALGSGVLRGDELNSILEQAPRLAKAIAEGMGTTIGNLRQMGQEGKLTSQDVFKAIRSQSDRLKMELGKIPWTFGQASNKMQNAVGRFFKNFEDKTGAVDTLAKKIAGVADYIERLNINNFIAGLRVAVIFAAALFSVAKWGSFIKMLAIAVKYITAMRNAYLLAAGASVVFKNKSSKALAMQMLMLGKFLLIAAAITMLVLLIQDFYKWITDPTADTMMKRWFGDFDAVAKKANEFIAMLENSPARFIPFIGMFLMSVELIRDLYRWFMGGESVIGNAVNNWQALWQGFCDYIKNAWNSFSEWFSYICRTNIIDLIKDAIGWLEKLGDKITETMRSWGEWLKSNFNGPLVKMTAKEFIQQGVHGAGPAASPDLMAKYGTTGLTQTSSNTSYNNSGNQTNYITVNTSSNASPTEIGNGVANGISHNSNNFANMIDNSNPQYGY